MHDSEGLALPLGAVDIREARADRAPPPASAERPLAQLRPGQTGRVSRIDPSDPARLQKLLALGILPGTPVRLNRRFPCFLVEIGHSQFAIDAEVAGSVHVVPS